MRSAHCGFSSDAPPPFSKANGILNGITLELSYVGRVPQNHHDQHHQQHVRAARRARRRRPRPMFATDRSTSPASVCFERARAHQGTLTQKGVIFSGENHHTESDDHVCAARARVHTEARFGERTDAASKRAERIGGSARVARRPTRRSTSRNSASSLSRTPASQRVSSDSSGSGCR